MRSTLPRAKRLEQLNCDRLGQRHRWEPPGEYLAVHTENPADGATANGGSPTTRNPTTPGNSHSTEGLPADARRCGDYATRQSHRHGGGASTLIDALLACGWKDLTVRPGRLT